MVVLIILLVLILLIFFVPYGVDVSYEGQQVTVDLHVVVDDGVNMASVSKNLEDSVKFLLKKIAEFQDVQVRVHIEGMRA